MPERKPPAKFSSLPGESLYEIFQYLEKDLSTLYSCLRVNRFWCKQVVPFLWRDPMPNTYTSVDIGVYIYFFQDEEKLELERNHGINIKEISRPLFNYEKYLKVLNLRGVRHAAFYWLKDYHLSKDPFFDECINFNQNSTIDFIETALFKLLLRNANKIRHLILALSRRYDDIPDVSIFTSEEYSGIKNISKFSFVDVTDKDLNNVQNLLYVLPTLCKKIDKFKFHKVPYLQRDYETGLTNLIKSQQKLISFNLTRGYFNVSGLIMALKDQSSSLKRLVLNKNSISKFTYLSFESLNNLEYLEIESDYPEFIITPLSKANLKLQFFKAKFLEDNYELKESIIKSSKFSLKELYLIVYIPMITNRTPLCDLCPNLTHLKIELYISYLIPGHTDIFLNYINNLKNLSHLSIQFTFVSSDDNNIMNDFHILDLPSLKYFSYKFDKYSLDSLENWYNQFSTRFNTINFYTSHVLDNDQITLLNNFAKDKDNFTLIHSDYKDHFKFVVTL